MTPFLIVGLGNPGKKYEITRHNAGFLFLDFLQKEWNFPEFSQNERFHSSLSEGSFDSQKIILAQPETFMNLSGNAIEKLLSFYKIPLEHLAVIHDDLDIALGTFRTATNSRSAGHNGVQSIIDRLGSQTFRRFRLGIRIPTDIENSQSKIPSDRFVLEPFPENELRPLRSIFPEIQTALEAWIQTEEMSNVS